MLGLLAWPRKSIWKNAQNRVGEEMALVVCKTQKENDEIAVDAKERQRCVRGCEKTWFHLLYSLHYDNSYTPFP